MYDELIQSLRCCADDPCDNCKFRGKYMDSCDGTLKNEAADAIEELRTDLKDCRNELCLKCGDYKQKHLGACDGCRWENIDG